MDKREIELSVLYDMIQINDERAKSYNKAIQDLHSDDAGLKAIFAGMSQQSVLYKQALKEVLQTLDEHSVTDGMTAGKIFQTWLDAKIAFREHDRQAILSTCELGEKTANKAYEIALDTDDLSLAIKSILASQQTELRAALNHIEVLRDSIS